MLIIYPYDLKPPYVASIFHPHESGARDNRHGVSTAYLSPPHHRMTIWMRQALSVWPLDPRFRGDETAG